MDTRNFAPSDAWVKFISTAQPEVDQWEATLDMPEPAQTRRLAQLLEAGCDTAFGRQHGFAEIESAEQYREHVPIRDTAAFLPWLERAALDPEPVLTSDRPMFFERTSGSTAHNKLIPYTPAFLRELQRAMIVWLAGMAREHPGITTGRAYWSMSPALQAPGSTPNGIAIGSASDLDYLGTSSAAALAATLLVPPLESAPVAWRRQTLRALVADETLAMLSVWSPTFLTSLLRPLFSPSEPDSMRDLAWIEENLPAARAAALRKAAASGRCDALWPRLAAVSSWMDGPSRVYAESLRTRFPAAVQWLPKGLFATEGIVSIPYGEGAGCPLAINSHYLEFVFDDGRVSDVSGLALGDEASVLLTTGGGLYRYAIGDRIRVTRFAGRTPCITFVGRAGASCDLVGEKLDERMVEEALGPAFAIGASACLVPDAKADVPHYVTLLAGITPERAETLRDAIEARLNHVFHYAHARRMGQLGPLRVRGLSDSATGLGDLLQYAAERSGLRAGDVKPRLLITRPPMAELVLSMSQRWPDD
ncbi:auxin-responsive GH3-related protein [Robbsia andropogonis]|uniref:Auxin-responsive GH3-related protein n=1 Tax=Robbsia andropogonis TaxID=28092 RepID=A0A0F5K2U7_9BURK|nr:GH3 auxin-responsive promoter family protein [Robbsia andropogonis]KKB64418.1 auxin-responsive GH3-related protein [Robbsia andropogonis]